MNTFKKIFASLSVFVIAATGFAGVEGKYVVDEAALTEGFKSMPNFASMPEAQQQQMLGMAKMMKISLVINEDGTFSVDADMMGQKNSASGTWVIEGDEVVVSNTVENGEVRETPEEGRLKIDGDKLLIQEEGMPFAMTMVKVAAE